MSWHWTLGLLITVLPVFWASHCTTMSTLAPIRLNWTSSGEAPLSASVLAGAAALVPAEAASDASALAGAGALVPGEPGSAAARVGAAGAPPGVFSAEEAAAPVGALVPGVATGPFAVSGGASFFSGVDGLSWAVPRESRPPPRSRATSPNPRHARTRPDFTGRYCNSFIRDCWFVWIRVIRCQDPNAGSILSFLRPPRSRPG